MNLGLKTLLAGSAGSAASSAATSRSSAWRVLRTALTAPVTQNLALLKISCAEYVSFVIQCNMLHAESVPGGVIPLYMQLLALGYLTRLYCNSAVASKKKVLSFLADLSGSN